MSPKLAQRHQLLIFLVCNVGLIFFFLVYYGETAYIKNIKFLMFCKKFLLKEYIGHMFQIFLNTLFYLLP